MNRRQSLRKLMLCSLGMALGSNITKVLHAQSGTLTCDLGQWGQVVFMYKGKKITVPISEVFAALSEQKANPT